MNRLNYNTYFKNSSVELTDRGLLLKYRYKHIKKSSYVWYTANPKSLYSNCLFWVRQEGALGGSLNVTGGPVTGAAGPATWSQVVWGGQSAACLSGEGGGLVKYRTEPTGVESTGVEA